MPPLSTHASDAKPSAAFRTGTKIKLTRSLCPTCLQAIDAEVFDRDGAVWMDKTCAQHGSFSALLSADPRHYYQANEAVAAVGSCCGPTGCGGAAIDNHSCNMLIEITDRCNLTCPTCYAESSPQRSTFMPLPKFEALLDDLLAKGKGDADLIQLSGGEPTLHPDLFAMIEAAQRRGISRVYVNTNGIRLAQPAFAERLAACGPGVSVYLQFDGTSRRTLRLLRGREDLVETKLKALAHCEALGIETVPVMTLARDINDAELGTFIETALAHPRAVAKVMIQPAMYSGRYDGPRLVERLTVADVAARIAGQTDGVFTEDDFSPIPCSDPNCFSMALAVRTAGGLVPVSRYFPRYDSWADDGVRELVARVSDTFDDASDLKEVIGWAMSSGALASADEATVDGLLDAVQQWQRDGAAWRGLFAIGIKPFMDAYTYDQDRIDKCCVHIIARDGTPVSFCEYNAIRRPQGTW